ncbi:MAG: hypothetical protein AB1510_10035 [Bacillota bacterium]
MLYDRRPLGIRLVTVWPYGYFSRDFLIFQDLTPHAHASFRKLVINECLGIPWAVPPGKTVILDKVTYLTEGNLAEIERLAYQNKVRIVWEEGGKKWEKVVSVTPEK